MFRVNICPWKIQTVAKYACCNTCVHSFQNNLDIIWYETEVLYLSEINQSWNIKNTWLLIMSKDTRYSFNTNNLRIVLNRLG